uniref:Peptidase A1 domain-containing protein n=1 Tax=Kalanchoe fedtschenkoi TaxID=63787 RepID=A0A7N0U4S3_KALFE
MSSGRRCLSLRLVTLISLLSIAAPSAEATGTGFTLSFIRRDSPNSPFYNSSHSHFTRVQTAISRSVALANRLATDRFGLESKSNDPESDILSASGEYLMNVSIGSPPFPVLAIADTGSDLIWTQCKPCSNCYDQKAPIFDPEHSSTYKPVSCSASQCTTEASGFQPSCDGTDHCQYSVRYGDQSYSQGSVATDTFTLGSSSGQPVNFPNVVFGCGFENQGTFSSDGSGIIGLGHGPTSLIGQLDKSIGGKFSYCLVPLSSKGTKSSEINFGENAVVSGDDVVSTPLVRKDPSTFYSLTLEAITVGTEKIAFADGSDFGKAAEKGNIIIDSGTTLTILPDSFYSLVEAEVKKQVDAKRADDPSDQLSLCYDAAEFKAPKIVANFEGADVKLKDFNAWVLVSDDVVCFAFTGSNLGIYGNLAQMNFLVGYDKEGMSVSFKPADCTKHN